MPKNTRLAMLGLLVVLLVFNSCRHSPQGYTEEELRARATVIEDCLSFVDEVEFDDYNPPVTLITDDLEMIGARVTQEAFERFARFYEPLDDGAVREDYLGRFMASLLLHQFWRKRLDEAEVYVTRGEVDDTFALIRQRFPGRRAFSDFLRVVRATPASLRAAVCRDLRLRKLVAQRVDLSVSDREVRRFFEAHRPSLEASLRGAELPEIDQVETSIREHLEATKLYAGFVSLVIEDSRPLIAEVRLNGQPYGLARSIGQRAIRVERSTFEDPIRHWATRPGPSVLLHMTNQGWFTEVGTHFVAPEKPEVVLPGVVMPREQPFGLMLTTNDIPAVVVLPEHGKVWQAMPLKIERPEIVGWGKLSNANRGQFDAEVYNSSSHNIWRAPLGALGYRRVLYLKGYKMATSQNTNQTPTRAIAPMWMRGRKAMHQITDIQVIAPADMDTHSEAMEKKSVGARLYREQGCELCHGTDGSGQRFPHGEALQYQNVAIVNRKWDGTMETRKRLTQHLHKHTGRDALSNAQLANLLNYVLHSWGNSGSVYSPEDIREVR